MFDTKKLLDQFTGSNMAGGLAGGLAGGALAGLLTNKKGRKLAGKAVTVGGLALVGGLAYKAWQNSRQGGAQPAAAPQPAASAPVPVPPANSGFLPAPGDTAAEAALGGLLLRAMISAAKADGQIDVSESQRILAEINRLELSPDEKAFLLEEYGRPLDLEGLVGAVDSPEHAAEVYAASVLILGVQPAPSEQIYLDALARGLRLDAALVSQIHTAVREAEAEGVAA
jgi:uncharacterized membrane protein YebE (DUF533 family)